MIIHHVEQGSDEWLRLRLGKPTASDFSKLVTSKGARSTQLPGYATTLAGELFTGKPLDAWHGNAWTERGKEVEAEARMVYSLAYDVDVIQGGFIDGGIAGCSPDGLIGDDGGLELKCPKAETHIGYLVGGKLPTEYVVQVQGSLWVSGRRWWDFLSYHPDFPILCVRVEHDQAMFDALEKYVAEVNTRRDTILKAIKAA